MINLYLLGINGKMGRAIQKQVELSDNFFIEKSISDPIDLIMDFSSPDGLIKGLNLALELNIPFLSGTTGLSPHHYDKMQEAGFYIPILYSANFSPGIFFLKQLLNIMKHSLDDYYIDIFESHHHHKKDSPSGTTLDLIKIFENKKINRDDEPKDSHRDKQDLNIFAKRTPYFSCEHTIEISDEHEIISIRHSSTSRNVYAKGALRAAERLIHREAGFYSVDDLIFKNPL